jgi:hypothetical protein
MKASYIFLIMAGVIASGCSPESKLRRARRLINEAEAAGITWRVDTVFKEIPIIIPRVETDTLVQTLNFRDTVFLVKDRLITKVKVNPITKTVYISSKCDSVVIIKRVPVEVNRSIKVGYSLAGLIWRVLLGIIIGFAVCWVLKTLRII